jgi:hypothetical protein
MAATSFPLWSTRSTNMASVPGGIGNLGIGYLYMEIPHSVNRRSRREGVTHGCWLDGARQQGGQGHQRGTIRVTDRFLRYET